MTKKKKLSIVTMMKFILFFLFISRPSSYYSCEAAFLVPFPSAVPRKAPHTAILPPPSSSRGLLPKTPDVSAWLVRKSTKATTTHLYTSFSSLHQDTWYCTTWLLLSSYLGIMGEKKTQWGKALSAPLITMALTLILANLHVIPFASPLYSTFINQYLVPLAIPLLLFDSDVKRIYRDTGTLLVAFVVGAAATIFGTVVAFPLLLPFLQQGLTYDNSWKVACALAARHIGGALNFVAVAETFQMSANVVSAAIAADNIVVALYFAFLFAISKAGESNSQSITAAELPVTDPESVQDNTNARSDISLTTVTRALTCASALVATGKLITQVIFPGGFSSLPVTSALTVFFATIFPKFFAEIRSAGTTVGILCVQLFFAASGAAGSIPLVVRQAPALFAFSAAQIALHFAFLMTVGRILRLPSRELYLASNANVGGPTTAAAMAQAKDWKTLVLPALLIGILGYATATGLALALGPLLRSLPKLV